jgi:MoaA/NifB/PqqE/SkfB family radical SAM enzyme
MLDNIQGFHIEPTNICTLKCPRCSRTDFINQFGNKWTNKNLNLDDFKNFLDIDLDNKVFYICGMYGDPIYYKDLIPMVAWLKSKQALVTIVTNGSYQQPAWWQELCDLLSSDDRLHFSIDGIPENFTQYRINADWHSIQEGVKIAVASEATVAWKYIPFSFNQDNIEQARQLSKDLGVDEFQLTPSDRFSSDTDWLLPSDSLVHKKSESKIVWSKAADKEIDPICINTNREHFISADGLYFPCCLMSDYRFYYKSQFYKNKEKYKISNTTISALLETEEFYKNINKTKTDCCTFNCPQL